MTPKVRDCSFAEPVPPKESVQQVGRYLAVGFGVGVVYVSLAFVLTAIIAIPSSTAAVFAYAVTTPLAFALHKRLTFQSRAQAGRPFLRFLVVSVILQGLGSIVESWMMGIFHLFAQVVVLWLLSSMLNFLAYRFVVFRGQP